MPLNGSRPSTATVEIIVLDNGSIGDTAGVCDEVKDRFPKHNWRYFYDDTQGLLTGRHLGATHCCKSVSRGSRPKSESTVSHRDASVRGADL
jgi:hypothetical protein